MGPCGPKFVLILELCSRLWVLVGFNMGIVWERPSRSPEGSRKGCRCIPLPDLLRQIHCKSICVPRLGLSMVCAAWALRSLPCQAGGCRAARQCVQGDPGSCGLAACSCAFSCNCRGRAGQREAGGGSGVMCVSWLRARIQSTFPVILERCRFLSSGTEKSLACCCNVRGCK